jgi:hypothetical protein
LKHPPSKYPRTLDGRYFVVRGRLWRTSNPQLPEERRQLLVKELMEARRSLKRLSPGGRALAKRRIDQAKQSLGERGAVWWQDGAPDFNRKLAKNTPYAAWFAALPIP